ncbi:MAG: cytochrome c [Halobacteriovoraceae bacterium]|nr:cytochrome c [Halobacteriovoraceae bacterium]
MFYDDFSVIEDSVAWINNHPKPKADFAIIKKELGAEIKLFKEIDDAAHNAANAIGVAAQEQDMLEVSKQYGVMVQSCTQCHETFRERLRAVLHP